MYVDHLSETRVAILAADQCIWRGDKLGPIFESGSNNLQGCNPTSHSLWNSTVKERENYRPNSS